MGVGGGGGGGGTAGGERPRRVNFGWLFGFRPVYESAMDESGRDGEDDDGDDGSADAPETWLRPVWADDDGDLDTPPWHRPIRVPSPAPPCRGDSHQRGAAGATRRAAAALARLDAAADAASPAVQQGLIARLAYAEAAGWLASQSITAHPVSLALRDRGASRAARTLAAAQGAAAKPVNASLGAGRRLA